MFFFLQSFYEGKLHARYHRSSITRSFIPLHMGYTRIEEEGERRNSLGGLKNIITQLSSQQRYRIISSIYT
jgi:hypothetical protein